MGGGGEKRTFASSWSYVRLRPKADIPRHALRCPLSAKCRRRGLQSPRLGKDACAGYHLPKITCPVTSASGPAPALVTSHPSLWAFRVSCAEIMPVGWGGRSLSQVFPPKPNQELTL